MSTFFSWIVANIGGVVAFVLILIYEILLLCGVLPVYENVVKSSIFLFLIIGGICTFAGGIKTKEPVGDFCNLAILIVIYYFAFDHARYLGMHITSISVFAWCIIPCLLFGIVTAVYAAVNFDEVVSLRMLYHNSDVAMFEEEALYTINRFVAGFSAATSTSLVITGTVLLKRFVDFVG